jgi:hypothetical protein
VSALRTIVSPAGKAALAIVVLCCALFRGEAAEDLEARVKAAFVPKLASFVNWPTNAFEDTNSPLVIGILGEDIFGEQFDADLKAVAIHGRSVVVQRFKNEVPTTPVHLLFVSASAGPRWAAIRRALAERPMLTLSDVPGFAKDGGMINFTKSEGKLRFEINLEAAKAAGLQISSRLLQVSTVVQGKVKR